MIYLDSAATSKPVDTVVEAIKPYIENEWFNPSAKYSKGSNVKDKIESVRASIAKEINVNSNEIYFTSGATESNNWAIRGFVDQCKLENKIPVIITTKIEHNSIRKCVENIPDGGYYFYIPVDKDGSIKINFLKDCLRKYAYNSRFKILVSVGMGNNEIGTIQNISTIANIVHDYGAILHTDATQCFGHIPINNQTLCADMISASAHKLGGLKGVGFLYKRNTVEIQPLMYGSQEQGKRGGTENVIGIIAFGEALKHIDYFKSVKNKFYIEYMIKQLIDRFGCKINGSMTNRLPNNINVTFPQSITGEALIYMLDTSEIYISSGSACNEHSANLSHVLQAIGLDDDQIGKTVRITLSDDIDMGKIDTVINEIERQIKILTL